MNLAHVLDEVGRTEKHPSKSLLYSFIAEFLPFIENKDSKVFPDLIFILSKSEDEMVVCEVDVQFLPKGPELKRRIWKLPDVLNHSGTFRVPVDIPNTCEVVFVGINDAGSITISPQVSGFPDRLVITDGDSGVEVLHGTVKIFLGSGGNDMIVVGHENDVMNKKIIFFNGFLKSLKNDSNGLSLVEAEGSIVGSTDQVVGQSSLDHT